MSEAEKTIKKKWTVLFEELSLWRNKYRDYLNSNMFYVSKGCLYDCHIPTYTFQFCSILFKLQISCNSGAAQDPSEVRQHQKWIKVIKFRTLDSGYSCLIFHTEPSTSEVRNNSPFMTCGLQLSEFLSRP